MNTTATASPTWRRCISPAVRTAPRALCAWVRRPDTVFCVGGLGDENIRTLPKMSREELCTSTGFDLMQPFALVTFHPETAPGAPDAAAQAAALCTAMAAVPGVFWLITGSNADAGGAVCTAAMQAFVAAHPQRAGFVQSLGLRRYLSAMQYAALVAGNSSSGDGRNAHLRRARRQHRQPPGRAHPCAKTSCPARAPPPPSRPRCARR